MPLLLKLLRALVVAGQLLTIQCNHKAILWSDAILLFQSPLPPQPSLQPCLPVLSESPRWMVMLFSQSVYRISFWKSLGFLKSHPFLKASVSPINYSFCAFKGVFNLFKSCNIEFIFPQSGDGHPLQCSELGNPMDREAWRDYGPRSHEESDST